MRVKPGQLSLFVCREVTRSLCAGAFAVRMAALAHDFGFVCYAFAMGAAVFPFVRGNAAASCVGAFLRSAGHDALLLRSPPEAAERS